MSLKIDHGPFLQHSGHERSTHPDEDLSQSRLRGASGARARRAPDGEPVKGEQLAEAQEIPLQFLEHILLELKHARLVRTKRGARGGYWLAADPPTRSPSPT